jgi:hypothetical protein
MIGLNIIAEFRAKKDFRNISPATEKTRRKSGLHVFLYKWAYITVFEPLTLKLALQKMLLLAYSCTRAAHFIYFEPLAFLRIRYCSGEVKSRGLTGLSSRGSLSRPD